MDMAATNLIEPGDRALVVNTGYFSDRFARILRRCGAEVTEVRAPCPGDIPQPADVRREAHTKPFRVMTITHVDTSTAVRPDVKSLAAIGRDIGALVVVDGVCSVGGEILRQDEWGVDLTLTASQKALGVPPGLALLVAGPRALERFRTRKSPPGSVYSDWNEWLPIMEAYEQRKPSYFATPAVNLIWALNISLQQILDEGMEARFARHRDLSHAFKAAMDALGLRQVPVTPSIAADTLTGLYYPEGLDSSVLGRISEAGVIVAGGLHPDIRSRSFRVGHMGAVSASDILATAGAIETALIQSGSPVKPGTALTAAMAALTQH
jgi:alanine-glyoxylate transaminase/serine-glyoxylate transaminase/serine-pyruvate transaminase